MSRPRKPTEVLKMQGSWRANTRGGEPKPEKKFPKMPEEMSERAREAFPIICEQLQAMKVLTTADGQALSVLCELYGRWREAENMIQKNGSVMQILNDDGSVKYEQQSPYVSMANTAAKLLQSYMREFGLTPASRSALHVAAGSDYKEDVKRFFRNA